MQPRVISIATLSAIACFALYGCTGAGVSSGASAGERPDDRNFSRQSTEPARNRLAPPQTQALQASRRSGLAEFLWNPPPEEVARSRVTYGALVLGLHSSGAWAEFVAKAEFVRRPLVWASVAAHAGYDTGTIREDGLERMAKGADGKTLRPIMPVPPVVVLVIYRTTDEIGMLTNVSADTLKEENIGAWPAMTAQEPLKEVRRVRIPLDVDRSHHAWVRSLAPPAINWPNPIRALIPYDSWDGWSFTMLRSQREGSDVSVMGRNIENRGDRDGEEATAALRAILGAAREIELHSSPPTATQPDE